MIPHRDTKYIVYRKQLLELVEKCPSCGLTLDVTEINKGSMVTFKRECSRCQEKTVWSSQPIVKDAMPAGNLEISAGICFTALPINKALRFFEHVNIQGISSSTYYDNQSRYLHPTINHLYKLKKAKLINELKQLPGGLVLGGDGRADSPGHSAKYGSYSLMELRMNRVIDVKLVQVFSSTLIGILLINLNK